MPRKRLPSRLHLLTVRGVQAAGDGDHSDGGGLILRIRDGSAAWVLRYTAATGKRREMGLGPCHRSNPAQAGESLTSARETAARARSQLQQGVDPIDERERLRAGQRVAVDAAKVERAAQGTTLARWARDYHARVIEPTRTTKHGAQWLSSLENHVPTAIWHKPISEIDAPDLLEALLAVTPHERARNLTQGDRVHETVSRVRQRLDAVFEDALFHKRCSFNPAAAIKRKLREATPRRAKGHLAALPYRDAPALVRELRRSTGLAANCLELGMLTAARTSELINATWSEFDLDSALWVVPGARMKTKEDHAVYLPPRAVELLREIKSQGLHADFVFPSLMDLERKKTLSNAAMLTLLGRLGLRDRTTVHGLCRSTFSTWANETGAARPDVIEACLAHEEGNRVRASYNRAEFAEERRALLAAWATYLGESNVVALPKVA